MSSNSALSSQELDILVIMVNILFLFDVIEQQKLILDEKTDRFHVEEAILW